MSSPLKRVVNPVKTPRPSSPSKRSVTEVKEFKFASDARVRRSPHKSQTAAAQPKLPSLSPVKRSPSQRDLTVDHVMQESELTGQHSLEMQSVETEEMVDEGVAVRMKAREIGMASILAWGETRSRYV